MSTSNHTITTWSILSLDLLYDQINTFFGSTVIDNAGRLSPERAEAQINAVTGGTFYQNGPLSRGVTDPGWSPDGLAAALGMDTSP